MSRGRILLTGATGFIGSHLARALLAAGWRLTALRRPRSSTHRLGDAAAAIDWLDLPEPAGAALPPVAEAPWATVIHAATCYGRAGEPASELVAANLLLPLRLLESAAATAVPLFLHLDTVLPPELGPYACSKAEFRQWTRGVRAPATAVVHLRLEHVYGPGDDPSRFIPRLVRDCLQHRPRIPLTDGIQRRDFIHVDDVVAGASGLVATPPPPGQIQTFHVGSGQPRPVRELARLIHRLTGSRGSLAFGALARRPGEPLEIPTPDTPLQATGWRPRRGLEEGLRETIDWVRACA